MSLKMEDIRGQSVDQLRKVLLGLREEQFNLRFQQAGGQLENTGRIKQVRRDIARVLTALNDNGPAVAMKTPAVKTAKKKEA